MDATNSAPGFQVGGRYNSRRGRYRFSADAAFAAAYNNQQIFATDITTVGTAIGTAQQSLKSQSFVPVLDGQFEMAYDLSRDIAIKTSVQINYLWDGVSRSNNATTNVNPFSIFNVGAVSEARIIDTDFIAAGFTFGVEWRR